MSGLDEIQRRVLAVLAETSVPWRLTGGAALVGYHLHHRTTHDLDLFLAAPAFDQEPRRLTSCLSQAGFSVTPRQQSPGFVRLDIGLGSDSVLVDLVAEPIATIEPPVMLPPGIWVDTPHEILVNKLTALLSRSELRDLEDTRQLVAAGGDLERALADAPRKDGSFSPSTLAWVLEQAPLGRASDLGFDEEALRRFRDVLVEQLVGADIARR